MRKSISTYYNEIKDGYYATVVVDMKEDGNLYVIEYYNDKKELIGIEEFPDNAVNYVEDAAENWAMGIKKMDF